MKNHFARLPTELRLAIFRHVFRTPTGVFFLLENVGVSQYTIITEDITSHRVVTNLKILRTCRQFYRDCRYLLWELNFLDLDQVWRRYGLTFFQGIQRSLVENVRSVQLDISLKEKRWDVWDGAYLIDVFAEFEKWENLKRLRLAVRSNWQECEEAFHMFVKVRKTGMLPVCCVGVDMLLRYLQIFEYARAQRTYFEGLEREIAFDFGEPSHPLDGIRSMRFKKGNGWGPDRVFEELSKGLGGDVVINGQLYYSHGVQKKQIFLEDPLDLQVNTYYLAKEFEAYNLAMKQLISGKEFAGGPSLAAAWKGWATFNEWLDEP